jgi:polyribonucleotide nucleotidyltransferase
MYVKKTMEVGGRTLVLETGEMARQADGAVMVTYGETMMLVTAVMGQDARDFNFLPLTVEYNEKTYAAGRIPGGYFKREGRPTENEILNCRIIDRPIRPLFDSHIRSELQLACTVLSMDRENDPSCLGILGASAALMVSDIPFAGPVASIKVGRIGGHFVANPTISQLEESELDLIVAVGREGVVMVEGSAKFVSEDVVVDALMFAKEQAQPLLDVQEEMARELNVTKRQLCLPELDEAILARVRTVAFDRIVEGFAIREKKARSNFLYALGKAVEAELAEEFPTKKGDIGECFSKVKKGIARNQLRETHRRIDGRTTTEVRPITIRLGVLPRAHGSVLFTRGETQALVSITLGTGQDEQRIETLMGSVSRRFMLHYNFPPFSVGEAKPMRGPSRRDIGHGHLAERGVRLTLPPKEDFPYTLRSVSEVLESNGSSSMATVCGTSLAMMDAGVPVTQPVAGVAMGLIKEGEDVFILSDILGDEDHMGDMDFKVVGGREGITAVQMDIKVTGLTREIMQNALKQARESRIHILNEMAKAITEPRGELSPYAPVYTKLHINPSRIKDLIGPGGKNIRAITEATGVSIEVSNDGTVLVASSDGESARRAIQMIEGHTAEAEVGKTYVGKVVKIADFGAFIEILPGVEGLCHISELSDRRVERVEDVLQEGDEVYVKCIGIDPRGKVKVSRRDALKRG